jgi:hypothetical protein
MRVTSMMKTDCVDVFKLVFLQTKIYTLTQWWGHVWSHDLDSYAGSSVATGRAPHARHVKGDDPVKNGYPGPPDLGLGMELTTPPRKKALRDLKEEAKGHLGRYSR